MSDKDKVNETTANVEKDDDERSETGTVRKSERLKEKEQRKTEPMLIERFWQNKQNLDKGFETCEQLLSNYNIEKADNVMKELRDGMSQLDATFDQIRCHVKEMPLEIRTTYDRSAQKVAQLLGLLIKAASESQINDDAKSKSGKKSNQSKRSSKSRVESLKLQLESNKKKFETQKLIDQLEEEERRRQFDTQMKLKELKQQLENQNVEDELIRAQEDESITIEDTSSEVSEILHPDDPLENVPRQSKEFKYIEVLAKSLSDTVNVTRLPPPEPSVFNGDPLHYSVWKSSFLTLIDSKQISATEKLHYLKKYVDSEAKECIEGTFFFDTDTAYKSALNMLDERYGNSFRVAEAFRDKLYLWPKISSKDGLALRKYVDFLRQCQLAMEHIDGLDILNDCRENRKMLQKLPEWLIQRWSRKASEKMSYPKFDEFVTFLTRESNILCNPVTSNIYQREEKKVQRQDRTSNTLFSDNKTRPTCSFCKRNNHTLKDCFVFTAKPVADKKQFLITNGVCFSCLRQGHLAKNCRNKGSCEKCQQKHPTCLHDMYSPSQLATQQDRTQIAMDEQSATNCRTLKGCGQMSSMIVPVYISLKNNPNHELLVYALLDTQSDTTFILEDTAKALDAKGEKTRLKLSTLTTTSTVECKRFDNFVIRGVRSDKMVNLPTTFSRQYLPVNRQHIPTPSTAESWNHLKGIKNDLLPLQECDVGLLIGYDCPEALAPCDFVVGGAKEPFAQKTILGWSICGRTSSEEPTALIHKILTKVVPFDLCTPRSPVEVSFVHKTKTKEINGPEILKCLERDFHDTEDINISQDDFKFLEIMENGIHKDETGHYSMPLPFRFSDPILPNNFQVALKRLLHLKRKFTCNQNFCKEYISFMEGMISRGEAEEVIEPQNPKVQWYIPHHGVYHSQKKKIRVVFDCSTRFKEGCLNDYLLQGPDLLNSLVGVMCRFREQPVAVAGDIEKMFHQFKVDPKHRDYLRFLWWKGGDVTLKPSIYLMKVHLFGATSSPGCANFGLKSLAADGRGIFTDRACDFLAKNFYVDDGLSSCSTEEEALMLIKETQALCLSGHLRFCKILSNSKAVMSSIPDSDKAEDISLQVAKDMTVQKILGIRWIIESDEFSFAMTIPENPTTKRGVLKTVASIYDPLGFIAPFILQGKQILQETCKLNIGWDEFLPEHLLKRWNAWLFETCKLDQLHVQRCYKPSHFGKVIRRELHHFSDASLTGYGNCSYLRQIDEENNVHCSLVFGKSRVTPIKPTTLPRLELTAAVTAVQISSMLQREMISVSKEFFWTDSKIVLGYLNNEQRRFHMFVANRVQNIRKSSKPEQWAYVSSAENPADNASRGLTVLDLAKSSWFAGPAFLWEQKLPVADNQRFELYENDPEIKKALVHQISKEPEGILKRFSKFSNWSRLVTAISTLKVLARDKRGLERKSLVHTRNDTINFIIKQVQEHHYSDFISGKSSKVPDVLYKLNPFLDNDGILRVGGRIQACSLSYNIKHPIILPRSNHITELIIQQCHEDVAHQGRGFTLCHLRESGFWVLGARGAVSSIIFKCVICRKLRGKLSVQKMSDLPQERLEPTPPFTHVGIDCFGPFLIKDRRKELKRYGLIVTCLASKAVHIELLDDLTTDSFINGLRCLIALRGPISSLRCDQGSNFMGAISEFKRAAKEIHNTAFREFLCSKQCVFLTNPPSASHMGGVWECQIRSIRSILSAMLLQHGHRLDSTTLRTMFYEIMAIINSRPLSVEDLTDPNGPDPLTPNNLITMKSTILVPPPGNFTTEDIYANKRWRQVQALSNEFWDRWRKSYLMQLQERQKWTKNIPNILKDDIVLLKEENDVRGQHRLSRVVEALPDKDGLVRKVKLVIGSNNGIFERPIHKLVFLLRPSCI